MAKAKDKSKRPPAKMPQRGMHDMGGHMMKDSEMGMTPELKARYPSMVKNPKRRK